MRHSRALLGRSLFVKWSLAPDFPLRSLFLRLSCRASHSRREDSSRRTPPRPTPIAETTLPSSCSQSDIADALRPHHANQTPLVLRGPLSRSDPVFLWKSWEYMRLAVGEDTPCDVEIGGSYTDPSVQRPTITFGDYLQYIQLFEERHGREEPPENSKAPPKREELVYLAQNDLFPGIANDIAIPELCGNAMHGVGDGHLYSTMIWLGPRTTVSPLHYDPLDNLLMQFVGRKRVRLYPKTEAKKNRGEEEPSQEVGWYYAGSTYGTQYNTSAVDVEEPDINRHPLFGKAPTPNECVLEPGDILFIPRKWWHHVRSLDTSVSVNVWWR